MANIKLDGKNYLGIDKIVLPTVEGSTAEFTPGGDGSISLNTYVNNGGKFAMYGGTSLNLAGVNTSLLTSFADMFNSAQQLLSVDVSDFDTSSATDMSAMFATCQSLTSLNLSNFVTTNVTNMEGMFGGGCSSLTSLNISNFNTENVTNMTGMFSNCSSLTSLDLSHFNTSNVTSFASMFSYCENLASLDIRNFDLSASDSGKGYEIWSMFDGVPSSCVIYVNQATYNILANNDAGLASLSMLHVVS